MVQPILENLEPRQLLSALAAGQAQLFDFNGDHVNDAVLVNTGASAIEYTYTGGSAIDRIDITASGASFTTNAAVVAVGDTNPDADYTLASALIGVSVKYHCQTYKAMAGDTMVVEGAIGTLQLGAGNLLSVQATLGNIDKVTVNKGDVGDMEAAGGIGTVLVNGDVTGNIVADTGDITSLSADDLLGAGVYALSGTLRKVMADDLIGASLAAAQIGTITAGSITDYSSIVSYGSIGTVQADLVHNANIQAMAGDIGNLLVCTMTGDAGYTNVVAGGRIGRIVSNTITGGLNGSTFITAGTGIGSLTVGLLEGGTASDYGFATASISAYGAIGTFQAGMISGGTATSGGYVLLNVSASDLLDGDGNVLAYGDVRTLRASVMTGGEATDGGEAMLAFTVSHDLVDARIGNMIGHDSHRHSCDPALYLQAGHDIVKLVVGQITAGNAVGEGAYAEVQIGAGHDIVSLTAGTIDAGTANGDGAFAEVRIGAGNDIQALTANTIGGGTANGIGATAGVFVTAGRDIDFIGAQLITGTHGRRTTADPTVQFWAGGDIGVILVGRITGGSVTDDGDGAQSSVLVRADGTEGTGRLGNIGQIVTGTIDGGRAVGENALSYVKISAKNDIQKLYSDQILGGSAAAGGTAYVSILAEHNIDDLRAGLISGTSTDSGCGCCGCCGGYGYGGSGDSEVQIQAYNDIKSFTADTIQSGNNGLVNILAGIDANGNVSGDGDAGSIEKMIVGVISGAGGVVNIAAGGDIENLKACRVVASGDGEVNIVAGGDITANVGSVRSWSVQGETGVNFEAGGVVNDVHNSIAAQFTSEGAEVEFPEPIAEV
jgi:hypothetical protein